MDKDILKERMLRAVGSKIRETRKELGLTQSELAKLVDINQSHIAKIELGKMNITLAAMAVIFDALGLKIDIK